MKKTIVKVANKEELIAQVKDAIARGGNSVDLNFIDTSAVTDMSSLFSLGMDSCGLQEFNGDISGWDVSHVEDMHNMFSMSQFNGDISRWDVSAVENMCSMFYCSEFTGDISSWDVRSVDDMAWMFHGAKFTGDISRWEVGHVRLHNGMFDKCPIPEGHKPGLIVVQQRLEADAVAAKEWMRVQPILEKCKANPLEGTTVIPTSKDELVAIIKATIAREGNGADLNFIDTRVISDMSGLFSMGISGYGLGHFNGDISRWDMSGVENMREMFSCSKFNGDISSWDVSGVKLMEHMFVFSEFNGDISRWDVSGVERTNGMFFAAHFDGDLSAWDMSSVKCSNYMFANCSITLDHMPECFAKKQRRLDDIFGPGWCNKMAARKANG